MCVNSGEKLGFSPLCARVSEIRGGKGDLTCCAQLFPMGFFLVGRGLPNFAAGAHNLNWIYLQHVHIQRMMIAYMLVMSKALGQLVRCRSSNKRQLSWGCQSVGQMRAASLGNEA